MKQAKNGADYLRFIKSIQIGCGIGLLVMVAGCVLAAALVYAQKLPESAIRYCAWAICALSAAAGCVTAQRLAGRANLPVSLGCSLLLLLVMAFVGGILGANTGAAWHGVLIVCITSIMAALITTGRGKRHR